MIPKLIKIDQNGNELEEIFRFVEMPLPEFLHMFSVRERMTKVYQLEASLKNYRLDHFDYYRVVDAFVEGIKNGFSFVIA